MTITNHILAGSIIGIIIKEPVLAVPLAFTSHFIMDTLPHFGYSGNKGYPEVLKHRISYFVGFGDFTLAIGVIFILIANNLWFPLICGIVATLPDAFGLYNYLAYEKKGQFASGILKIFHVQFHRKIQTLERPWGIYIEIAVFITLLSALFRNIF